MEIKQLDFKFTLTGAVYERQPLVKPETEAVPEADGGAGPAAKRAKA